MTAEPSYTAGSTNSLYFCDLNVFSDGDYAYSDVSLSSSYEAAKLQRSFQPSSVQQGAGSRGNGCAGAIQHGVHRRYTDRIYQCMDGQSIIRFAR